MNEEDLIASLSLMAHMESLPLLRDVLLADLKNDVIVLELAARQEKAVPILRTHEGNTSDMIIGIGGRTAQTVGEMCRRLLLKMSRESATAEREEINAWIEEKRKRIEKWSRIDE